MPRRSLRFALTLAALAFGACRAASPSSAVAQGELRAAAGSVVPGVEVLVADSLHVLQGKRVGLITNHSGRDRQGRSSIDILHRAPGVRLVALFAPEHGLRGTLMDGVKIASGIDSATGVPIRSLYGETRVPTPAMLEDIDVLVYDIQDVGARVYTYEWTMALSANAAGKLGKEFVVLDRPNPIRADRVEGPMLDTAHRSFVGQYPVALRYGMTPGELLRYLVGTGQVTAPKVTVIPMRNYTRAMWWDRTGVPWVNPSPNLRDLEAVTLYPGTVFFEGVNATEGRGTDAPFKQVGASWLTDAGAIAAELNAKRLPGVRFDSVLKTVEAGAAKFPGQTIPMIRMTVTDREAMQPIEVGMHLLRAIHARHPNDWQWRVQHIDNLFGTPRLRAAVEREGGVEALIPVMREEARRFAESIRPYLIYR